MWRKREIEELKMQDDEFNRIERESIARKMAVKYAISKAQVVHIPEITEEEWKALNDEENLRQNED
jgi:phosphopantetheinyl transferase (holo-ACP synthase)